MDHLPRVGTLLTDRQAAAGEPWIWMKVKREKVLTDIVQHAGDFFVFGGSLTLGGLSCRWKGGKDRLFGWGSAAQVDPGVGRSPGPPVHLSSSTHFSFPSLLLPPSP